jgi:hypothetical protein
LAVAEHTSGVVALLLEALERGAQAGEATA